MMGKKNKKKNSLRSSSLSTSNEFSSFQDDIIQHLQPLKESSGLIIGFNAVLRRIKTNSLCAVIYISRKGTSAMYNALNVMCKGKDVLFLNFQDINPIVFSSKIPSSTTYGIKKNIIEQPQFSRLVERINIAKNRRKNKKEKIFEKSYLTNEDCLPEKKDSHEDIKNDNPCKNKEDGFPVRKNELNCIIHPKHSMLKLKFAGKEGMLNFQEVNFPNYKVLFNQIPVSIK